MNTYGTTARTVSLITIAELLEWWQHLRLRLLLVMKLRISEEITCTDIGDLT